MRVINLLEPTDTEDYIFIRRLCDNINYKRKISRQITNDIVTINKILLLIHPIIFEHVNTVKHTSIQDKSMSKNYFKNRCIDLNNKNNPLSVENVYGRYYVDSKIIRIYIDNKDLRYDRYTFTYLHEFGHHLDYSLKIFEKLIERYDNIYDKKRTREIIANIITMQITIYIAKNYDIICIGKYVRKEIYYRIMSDLRKLKLKEHYEDIQDIIVKSIGLPKKER